MKQLREVWSCTRDNDEADESYFVLNPFFFLSSAPVPRARWRVEMKRLRAVWSSCIRDNDEADESYFVFNPFFFSFLFLFATVPSQGSEKKDLTMGTHTFPFEFQLPPTLPASFQHCVGRVTYSVKGVIDLPWAIDVTTKSPFTVGSILDLNLWPDVKVFCSFVFLRRRKVLFFVVFVVVVVVFSL